MRHWLLILVIVAMPLQWRAAVAASLCQFQVVPAGQAPGVHRHDHATHAGVAPTESVAESSSAGVSSGAHAAGADAQHDHHACQGLCAPALLSSSPAPGRWAGDEPDSPYQRFAPDRFIEPLLRPPLHHLA